MTPAASPLLCLLRSWPEEKERIPGCLEGADPAALVHSAARHGLAGLVQHLLQEAGASLAPAPAGGLKRHALSAAAYGMRVKALLLRALDALAAEGVVPAPLKGYPLAQRLYPDPLLRATSDVDLLVSPEELPAAERAIRSLGLAPKKEADDYYPVQYRHHLCFAGKPGMVELHFRPMTAFGIAWESHALLARAKEGSFEGRAVRLLREEDELVYLCLHAANHMLQRLAWLLDLKLLARSGRLDWEEVVRAARESGLPALAFYALEASQRVLGAPIPEATLRELCPSIFKAALARRVFSEQTLASSTLAEDKAQWKAAKLLLAQSYPRIALFSLRRVAWNMRSRLRRG
ncbi:MAG: nucleotidyltransferase family protein [Myxococcales bacterium]|nr:nucleotidyltransferase family protein [Myxococcales bacterium]